MTATTTLNLTETEFISSEISKWGYGDIESLIESGFEAKLTNKGWTWIYNPSAVGQVSLQTLTYCMN